MVIIKNSFIRLTTEEVEEEMEGLVTWETCEVFLDRALAVIAAKEASLEGRISS
jgi:hypothetical protein